jgi:hypothetical protein
MQRTTGIYASTLSRRDLARRRARMRGGLRLRPGWWVAAVVVAVAAAERLLT